MNTGLKMNNDILLTPHFKLSEFTLSASATKYCINNSVPERFFNRIRGMAVVLEYVRTAIDDDHILITSGYRCPALNKIVGGVPDSKHTQGVAVDFTFPCFHARLGPVMDALSKHSIRFVKIYPDKKFIHVDFPIGYLEFIGENGFQNELSKQNK